MNLLKRRRLEKLAAENAKKNQVSKMVADDLPVPELATKGISKNRQRMLKRKAQKEAKLNSNEDADSSDQLTSEVDGKVESIKDDLASELDNKVEGAKDDLANELDCKVENAKDELDSKVEDAKDELAEGLENQVEGVKDELANELDSKVEDAKDELAADLENQTGELGEELDSLKDDVGNLEGRVDEHEDNIQALKSQFEGVESTGNPELETHKAIAENCLKEMSSIDDIDERLPYKAEACKRLEAFVTGYMESGAKYPNSVAVWFMIWLFDLGDIAKAVPLALHLSAQKVHKMPKRFKSSEQAFICDEVYKWAVMQLEANKSAGPYLDDVIQALEANKWKLPVLVNGMMYVIRGKHLEANGEFKAALADFEKAMSINSRAGATKKIEKLKTKLGIE